jgi:HD domain
MKPRSHRRVGDVTIPDSAAAREAERVARDASSPMLYGHAARSYLYGALLGDRDGMVYDAELLYVSALMHDLGLTPGFDDPLRPFEVVGADACAELVERHGWDLPRRYLAHRAIVLHMAPSLSPAEETEVLLLDAGISCDCSGARYDDVGRRAVEEVLRVHPRAGFKSGFAELLRRQAERKPQCHAALMLDAGLEQRIEDAPYPD